MTALALHTAAISALALHPDGSRATSGDAEGRLVVWDPRGSRSLWSIEAHHGRITALAIDAGAGRILSAGVDKSWKTWDLETGRCLDSLTGHSRMVAITAPPRPGVDGVVVSRSFDHRTLTLLGVAGGARLGTLAQQQPGFLCVAFHASLHRMIAGGWEGVVQVWDLDRAVCVTSARRHKAEVTAVVAHPDGRRAISTAADGWLCVWDLETAAGEVAVEAHKNRLTGLAVADLEHPVAVTGGADARVRGWDLSDGHRLADWTASGPVTACAVRRLEPEPSLEGYRAPARGVARALVSVGDEAGNVSFFEWTPFSAR